MDDELLFVEFFGLPGSGKTTVVKELYQTLVKRNFKPILYSDLFSMLENNTLMSFFFNHSITNLSSFFEFSPLIFFITSLFF